LLGEVIDRLGNVSKISIFDDVEPNPKDTTVEKGLGLFKEKNCDSILGLGGGSPMDTAKAIAAMSTNPGKINEYCGVGKLKNPAAPLLLIPTTAGTGSEVSRGAVITDSSRNYKMLILSWFLAPKVAILDPKLTVSLPPRTTAWTGVDALTHAMEAYVSTFANPITDVFALDAIRLISANLRKAVKNGKNLDARSNMLLGSLLAGVAMTNALLGNVHALAHPVGGHFDTPHGLTCAVLLPVVMEFNLEAIPKKFANIAEAMGKEVKDLSEKEAARKAIEAVRELCVDLEVPENLSELGVNKEAIPQMVKDAVILPSNPRETTKEDLAKLYEKAF